MELWGYLASVLIGISLGVIGGGGSILTVPVLVYLFGVPPLLATSYSLFVVGATSLIGAFSSYRNGWVSIKTALLVGTTSISTVFLTRKLIVVHIPETIATIGPYTITEPFLTMVLFAILMLAAAFSMIKNGEEKKGSASDTNINLAKLLAYGVVIGLVTGMLGAGGGFLLIPALVLLVRLPMKKAVGTSLLIIALNSLIGFLGDLGHFAIDWWFLLTISLIAIAGIFIGGWLSKKVSGEKLKKAFGWFVLVMGVYIILKETIL